MADHAGNLAEIEEGRSLLPAIVEKEQELKDRLADAKSQADKIVRDARDAAAKAVADAQEGFPATEKKFLEAELKKFEGDLKDLEKSERARLDELRSSGSKNVAAAAKAVAALVVASAD